MEKSNTGETKANERAGAGMDLPGIGQSEAWDALQEGVLVHDADGLLFINRAARTMFCLPGDQPLRATLPAGICEDGSPFSWFSIVETGGSAADLERVLCFAGPFGRRWLRLHTVPLRGGPGVDSRLWLTTVCDVTASRRQDNFNLVLNHVYEMIMAEAPMPEIFTYLCNQMVAVLDFAGVWIGIKMPDGSVALRGASDNIREALEPLHVRWDFTVEGSGSVGRAIRGGRCQVNNELAEDPGYAYRREFFAYQGLRSLVTFPLRVRREILGVITFYGDCPNYFTEGLVKQLEPMADEAALAIYFTESRRTENKYRLLMEHSPDIFLFMTSAGSITDINHVATQAYGYSRDELLHMNIVDLRAPETMSEFKEQFALAQAKGLNFETVHLRRGGATFPVEVSGIGVEIEGEHLVMSVIRDISERHLAQQALHREKEWLRVTLSSIGDAVVATDPDSRVTFMNPVAEHLTGWVAAEALGKPVGEVFRIINEETGRPAEIPIEKVLRDGTVVGLANHTILISKDGPTFPIADAAAPIRDQSGRVSGVVIVFRDDTERKKAERDLQDTNRRLADIIDFLPDSTFVIDINGTVIAWNKAIERMTGISSKDILGKGNYEYAVPFHGYRRPILIDFALHFDEEMASRYVSIFRRHGDTFFGESAGSVASDPSGKAYLWFVASVLRNSSGEVIGAIGTIRDITAHKLIETTLIRAKEEAEKANRAKDDFLAKISHEIRTPLNSILGMTEMLFGTPLNAEQHDYVSTMQESASLLLGIINDILDFSRIKAGEILLQKIDFQTHPLIDSVIKIVAQKAREKGLHLSSRLDPRLPAVLWGDPLRLHQILLNLTFNAVKFTECGGISINVQVENEEVNHVTVRFEISDSGIGIPAEERQNIFLPFVQMDGTYLSAAEGTGLGLTIANWLVQRMGGEIGLESEVGRGSTFWFTLRMERALGKQRFPDAESAPALGDICPPNGGPSGLILLAEDNPVNIKMTLLQLRKLGFDAGVVTNGREAVDAALTGDYVMILMDLQMPVMDGFEAIRIIRGREALLGRHIPVIALTAHALQGYRDQCLAAGADDYLTKPVRLQELRWTLSTWLKPGRDTGEVAGASSVVEDHAGEVIDAGFLAEACGDGETGLKVLEELADIFTNDSGDRLAELRRAVELNDARALREAAHRLKSGSNAVGARALASIGAELEALGKSGATAGGWELIMRVQEAYEKTLMVLKAMLRRA